MKNKPFLIALGYKRRRGKNTVASIIRDDLIKNYGYSDVVICSFAAPIKEHVLKGIFGLTEKDIEQYKSVPVPGVGLTTRELLQKIGTDYFRKTYGADIWVKAFERDILSGSHEIVLVADLRFPEEVSLIRRQNGILIRVDREIPHEPEDDHVSETALDQYDGWDYALNNNMSGFDMLFEIKSLVKKIFAAQNT